MLPVAKDDFSLWARGKPPISCLIIVVSPPMASSDGRGAGRAKKKAPVPLMGPVTYGEGDRGSGWFMERYRGKLQKHQKEIYFCSKICTKDHGLFFMKFRSAKDRTYVYIYIHMCIYIYIFIYFYFSLLYRSYFDFIYIYIDIYLHTFTFKHTWYHIQSAPFTPHIRTARCHPQTAAPLDLMMPARMEDDSISDALPTAFKATMGYGSTSFFLGVILRSRKYPVERGIPSNRFL